MHNSGTAQYIKEKLRTTQFYKGNLGETVVVACFGEDTFGELTKFMHIKHGADIGIIINSTSKDVKMVNITHSDFNFDKFTSILGLKLKDNVSTGELNEKIIEFTKRLILC